MGKNTFLFTKIMIGAIVMTLLGALLYVQWFSQPKSRYDALTPLATHTNGQSFVGSEQCKECHQEQYDSHIHTAHFLTSAIADANWVKGSFKKGENEYSLNDSIVFKMITGNGRLYQTIWNMSDQSLLDKSPIDLVIGSGTKGQSYLTWDKDQLYQLQISYSTVKDGWTNSPGLPMQPMERPRPVNAKCMECHATFAKNTSLYGMGNSYDREQILFGVDCERCHGPGEQHVQAHRQNPTAAHALHIIKQDTLPRQQRLDACALCHSGVRVPLKPAFQFLTGDTLLEHSLPGEKESNVSEIDVHGNQFDLLRESTCFKESPQMDCTTCHDPHKNQRGNTVYFNQKCMGCHPNEHPDLATIGATSSPMDCISCHMPLMPSKAMLVRQGRDSTKKPVYVRTHLIKTYQEKLMAKSQNQSK